MQDIEIIVVEESGEERLLKAPTDMGLSLMEFLKGNDYPIEAVCGGMALCATCHIEVLNDIELPEKNDAEWEMLDTLPNLTDNSRLSCQLKLHDNLNGIKLRILGEQ